MCFPQVARCILGGEDEVVSRGVDVAFVRKIEVVVGTGGIERNKKAKGGVRMFYSQSEEVQSLEAEAVRTRAYPAIQGRGGRS